MNLTTATNIGRKTNKRKKRVKHKEKGNKQPQETILTANKSVL